MELLIIARSQIIRLPFAEQIHGHGWRSGIEIIAVSGQRRRAFQMDHFAQLTGTVRAV
ncbi:hypothetical protein D3C73_1675450 [compost metagenome]